MVAQTTPLNSDFPCVCAVRLTRLPPRPAGCVREHSRCAVDAKAGIGNIWGWCFVVHHEHKYRIVERDDEVGGRGGDGAWVHRLPRARDR